MSRLLFIWTALVAAIVCFSQSEAFWQSRDSNYNISVSGGGGGYTGPGDVVAATAWYGMRAYTTALAGGGATTTKVADLTGSGGGSPVCTIFLKGNGTGGVDLTTAGAGGSGNQCLLGATTFCTITNASCTITKYYDQTGNGNDLSTVVDGFFPTFHFSALGSNPAMDLSVNTANDGIKSSFAGKSQPWSIAAVLSNQTHSNTGLMFGDGAFNGLYQPAVANQLALYAGTSVFPSATDSQFHSISMRADDSGTGSAYSLDSAAATTGQTFGTAALGATIQFGPADAGYMLEAGIWTTLNNTQLKSINDNAAAFYGSFPQ